METTIPVDPNRTYLASAWIATSEAEAGISGGSGGLEVLVLDSSGQGISSERVGAGSEQWQQVSTTFGPQGTFPWPDRTAEITLYLKVAAGWWGACDLGERDSVTLWIFFDDLFFGPVS
jgi:hypothetical protein